MMNSSAKSIGLMRNNTICHLSGRQFSFALAKDVWLPATFWYIAWYENHQREAMLCLRHRKQYHQLEKSKAVCEPDFSITYLEFESKLHQTRQWHNGGS